MISVRTGDLKNVVIKITTLNELRYLVLKFSKLDYNKRGDLNNFIFRVTANDQAHILINSYNKSYELINVSKIEFYHIILKISDLNFK